MEYWNGFYETEKENIPENIIKWYIDFTFKGNIPKISAILNARVEQVKGLARYICFDPKRVNELIEEYRKEVE